MLFPPLPAPVRAVSNPRVGVDSLAGLGLKPAVTAAAPVPAAEPAAASGRRLRVHHRVAGRLRITIAGLNADPVLTRRLVAALTADAGVRSVRANPACDSLVIHHALDTEREERIDAHIWTLLEPLLDGQDAPAPSAQWQARKASTRRAAKPSRTLTWPLADLSQQGANAGGPQRRRSDSGAGSRPLLGGRSPAAPVSLSAASRVGSARSGDCWLCALYRQLLRAMVRFSLRCWWRDRRQQLGRLVAASRAMMHPG